MSQPLRGALVIERVSPQCPPALRLALAFAGRMVADLGAQVVVVHAAGGAQPDAGTTAQATPAPQTFLDLGKQVLGLPGGLAGPALHALQRHALATLEDQPSAPPAAGTAQVPLRVFLSMFGPGVPASMPATEFTVMALGGLLDIVGEADQAPLKLAGHQLAYSAGLAAFSGLMAVLATARHAPVRETVHVNLLDTAVWLNWKSLVAAARSGTAPTRSGNRSEWRVMPCADGWVAMVYRDADWGRLKGLFNDARLQAECFATPAGRREHAAALDQILQDAMRHMSRQEIHLAALANRLPLGPVYSPDELVHDRQNLARRFLRPVSIGAQHSLLIPRLPVLWNGHAVEPAAAAPAHEMALVQ